MENKIITIITERPFKIGKKYFFWISDKLIREKTIDPDKYYELKVREFDETK